MKNIFFIKNIKAFLFTVVFLLTLPLLILYGQNSELQWRIIGYNYLDSQQPQKAVIFFRQAVSANKGIAIYRQELAYALQKSGEYEEALNEYSTALALPNSNIADIKYNIGVIYSIQEKYTDALRYFSEVITFDDTYTDVYLNKANVELNKKDYTAAEQDYKTFLKRVPDTTQRKEIEQVLSILASLKTFKEDTLNKESYNKKQQLEEELNKKRKRIDSTPNKYLTR